MGAGPETGGVYAGAVDLATALRAHDCRITRPRQVVWDVLTATDHHLSAQEIADAVRQIDPGVNVSSVYRVLSLFADIDLVRESRLGDDTASTWERSHADGVIHLLCTSCNRVLHHHTGLVDRLHATLAEYPDFTADAIDVRVTGRCRDCS